MPGIAANKKNLYLGKCLGDLQKLTDIKVSITNVKILIKSSSKVFSDAEAADETGDEEKAYVMYMKYFNILTVVRTKADYKKQKEYFDNLIGRKNQLKAIERAEYLSGNLKERYALKEAEVAAEKLPPLDANSISAKPEAKQDEIDLVEDSAKEEIEVTPSTPSGSITCLSLCELLRDTNTKVIVMDARPQVDFNQSHISHTDCISVPKEILSPGSTVNHIQAKLSDDSKAVWMQRKHADHIVLTDWKSTLANVVTGTPLKTLKDALFKFDMTTIIKSEPLVLEGGYEQWLLYYPTMTTNAHVARPSDADEIRSSSPTMTLDFDYPDLDENLQKVTAPVTPGFSQAPPGDTGMNNGKPSVGIPQINRSLKPSWSFESQPSSKAPADPVQSLGHNNAQTMGATNSEDYHSPSTGQLYPDVSASSQSTKYSYGKNTNILNEHLANGPKNTSLSIKNNLATDLSKSVVRREEKEAELRDFQRARDDALKKDQKRLDDVEKKLHDLELIKKREEKDVADLMRMKRKLKEELEDEKRRQEQERTHLAAEETKRLAALDQARKEEGEKKQRLQDVQRLRQERKKDEQERELIRKQKEDEEKRLEAERQEQIRTANRQQEERELERKLEEEKRKDDEEALQKQQEIERQTREAEVKRIQREQEELARKEEEQKRQEMEKEVARKRELAEQEARKRQEMEKMKEEEERKRKEEAERKRQEEIAKQKAQEEREALERTRQMKASEQASSKMVPSTMLPPGWEKRLDRATNRYFYIDHNHGVTHWFPPNMPASARPPDTYTTKLKDERSVSSSRGLTRSHSSPNIKKQLEEEEEKIKRPMPTIDRGNKPSQTKVIPKQPAYVVRKRDLNPVFGNVGPALTGLRNLGNTCYMNSTIQCLNNASPLVIYFLNDQYLHDINRESSQGMHGEVVDEFAAVIKALWCQQYRSITPRDLKNTVGKYNPMFAGYQQQDSQEFLTFLLDGLHEGLNEVRRAPDIQEQNNDNIPDHEAAKIAWHHHKLLHRSIIVELFQGQLKSTLMCGTCRKTSVTFQAFMFLSLPIPATSKCSLKDCMKEFLKPEMMTGSSRWKCPRCKRERDSEKKIDIWKVPPILLVGLNRFYSEGMWMQKKTTHVDFPVNDLDFSPFISGPPPRNRYHLYGISNHYGTMEGGHYTAVCRNPVKKRWYKFDDQDVYEISESDVKTAAAFVLYYSSVELAAPTYRPHL